MQAHRLRERLVALDDGVPQVAHRDQLAQFQVVPAVHQQLQHQLERRALALQHGRDGDQRLHQRRAEGVDLAEHLPVGVGGQQGGQHVLALLQHLLKGVVQGLAGHLVHRPQQALLGNRRQVAVFQVDAVKARLPVPQHVGELHAGGARQGVAHQLAQVALARHKTHQRDRPIGVGRLDQLDQLGALAADEADVRGMAGQPQHQLVEEQDHRVIAQILGMPAHDGQPVVQRHKGLAAAGQAAVGREELADQVAHQAGALQPFGRLQHRGLKADRRPAGRQRAPATSAALALVELGEKGGVAELAAHRLGVPEQALGQVKARHRCVRVQLAHMLGVVAQDGRLHVALADHVVGHHQELAAAGPAVACCQPHHRVGQFRYRPGLGVAGQQQVEHRHEVRLARAKRAVQVGRLAAVGGHRLLDKAQRVLEGLGQLRRHDIVAQRLLGLAQALRQLEHEVARVHPLGDGDQVFEQRHLRVLPRVRLVGWTCCRKEQVR